MAPQSEVDIKVVKGGQKHVFAATKYQAGKLGLVPFSPHIGLWAEGTAVPANHIVADAFHFIDSKKNE